MAVNQTSQRWKLWLAVGASVLALACGDDSGTSDNGDTPPATGVVLANGIVGKECTIDGDCGSGGICKKSQMIGGLSDILTLIGVNTALPAPGGYCSISCVNNSNCGQGGVCFGALGAVVMGECRKTCTTAMDCRSGYECAKMASMPDGGVAGGALALPAQCQALPPIQTLMPNVAGAACSDAPDAGAALNNACGDGTCAIGQCTATCVDDSTCGGAGSTCVPNGVYGTTGSCQESCNLDTDCNQYTADGDVGCVEANGRKLCQLKQFPLAAGVLGKACSAPEDCDRGTCATNLGTLFAPAPAPDGYCTLTNCQDDSVCTGGVCVAGSAVTPTRCFDSCTLSSECRSGYSCQDRLTTADVTTKVCAPDPVASDAGTATRVSGGLDAGI